MPFVPMNQTINRLAADQAVAASTTLVDVTGWSITLPPTKIVDIEIEMPFSLGATGGFKFQLTSTQTAADYSARFVVFDGSNAGAPLTSVLTATGSFANALAIAANHLMRFTGSLKGHATLSSTVSFQFACNSAANAITALKGSYMKLIQQS